MWKSSSASKTAGLSDPLGLTRRGSDIGNKLNIKMRHTKSLKCAISLEGYGEAGFEVIEARWPVYIGHFITTVLLSSYEQVMLYFALEL
jgi:hypothetical protein